MDIYVSVNDSGEVDFPDINSFKSLKTRKSESLKRPAFGSS